MSASSSISRRAFLALSAGGAAGLAAGCGGVGAAGSSLAPAPGLPPRAFAFTTQERQLVEAQGDEFAIVTRGAGKRASVLRRLARPVPPGLDLSAVARRMERTMRKAKGVGLAGPQVGLSLRVATLMLDARTKHPRTIFVRNPVIVERSDRTVEGYEGCLSVPGVGGLVRRHAWVRIQHTHRDGSVLHARADGFNAVLWQHELDHLDGVLYLDKLQGELLPMDEVRRRRKELQRKRTPPAVSLNSEPRELILL
jgi:peptide deformylase